MCLQQNKQRTIKEKRKILKAYDSLPKALTKKEAAFQLKIPESTLRNILKNRTAIESALDKSKKRHHKGIYDALEKSLAEWMRSARRKGYPINRRVVKDRAKDLAEKLNIKEFTPNNGWLYRFQKRQVVSFKIQHGEGCSADVESAEIWRNNRWPQICLGWKPHQIWNCDDTWLCWRCIPNGSLTFKDEISRGHKKLKEKFTTLFWCNMAGQTREMPAIGRSARPLSMRDKPYPAKYTNSKKSCMTSAIFIKELQDFDEELELLGEKALVLLDNAPVHPTDVTLRNIQLEFLPPNTTSVVQPLDAGIIAAAKSIYRRKMTETLISSFGEDVAKNALHVAKKISIHKGIEMFAEAWNEISPQSIKNCWKKCGIELSRVDEEESDKDQSHKDDIQDYIEPRFQPNFDENTEIHGEDDDNCKKEEYSEDESDDDMHDNLNLDINGNYTEIQEEQDNENVDSDEDIKKTWEALKTKLFNRGYNSPEMVTNFENSIYDMLSKFDNISLSEK